MDRLIFTAVSGMTAAMNRQRVIASNMSNAQTTGFRAETLQSTPMTLNGPRIEVRSMNQTQVKGADMRAGTIVQTGNVLDVALQGDTMLAVQTPDGGEGYTRRGDLAISASGLLQNGEGLPVLGQNGPITVPLGSKITISEDGSVLASNPSTPGEAPTEVDRLKVVNYAGTRIEKDLSGLFRVPNNGVLPTADDAKVIVGALEGSNVKPTEVMVEMVEAQRSFDMRTKLIATARDIDEGGASLMRITPG